MVLLFVSVGLLVLFCFVWLGGSAFLSCLRSVVAAYLFFVPCLIVVGFLCA